MTDDFTRDMPVQELAGGKILAACADGVGVVTFNQPEKHNAISVEMWLGLAEILDEFAHRRSVRSVILTGAGCARSCRAPTSASSSSSGPTPTRSAPTTSRRRSADASWRVFRSRRSPVFAAIAWVAAWRIAMQADIRIAARPASSASRPRSWASPTAFDGLRNLVSLVGPAHARMIMYTGAPHRRRRSAPHRPDQPRRARGPVARDVFEFAQQIADNAPLSVAASKLASTRCFAIPRIATWRRWPRPSATCFDSEDYREGRAAFREKRQPQFVGR